MSRFLGVASLLLSSQLVFVAVDDTASRIHKPKLGVVLVELLGCDSKPVETIRVCFWVIQ